ncbi:hypothetical protein B0H14DRAFT_2381729 [Mycena olivaceomarginata]|nr:hypothetical protein B0H14DRAFT_2381729 [Mycena olivaceomarginata]
MFNPYALGGWSSAANLNADSTRNTVPQPSIFGALPYPTQDPPSMFISFRFTSFSPSILDCTVVGPQAKTHFHISTDIPTPGFTTIFDTDNEPMTIIEWLPNPVLEIRGIVPKQRISGWLALSPAKRYRTMVAQGRTFIWAPDGESICLYAPGLGVPQTHARLTREDGAVALEITADAIRIGLLPVCVTAAFLLQSGRNID